METGDRKVTEDDDRIKMEMSLALGAAPELLAVIFSVTSVQFNANADIINTAKTNAFIIHDKRKVYDTFYRNAFMSNI